MDVKSSAKGTNVLTQNLVATEHQTTMDDVYTKSVEFMSDKLHSMLNFAWRSSYAFTIVHFSCNK